MLSFIYNVCVELYWWNMNTELSLLEAPGAKTLRECFSSLPFVRHRGLIMCYRHVMIYASPQQSNRLSRLPLWSWTTYVLHVFVYGFRQNPNRSVGRFYFVGALLFFDNLQTHLGALLFGRVLRIGTLWYAFAYIRFLNIVITQVHKPTTAIGLQVWGFAIS